MERVRAGLALLFFLLILLFDYYIAYWETCLTSVFLEIDFGAVNSLAIFLLCRRCLNLVTLALLQVLLEGDFRA